MSNFGMCLFVPSVEDLFGIGLLLLNGNFVFVNRKSGTHMYVAIDEQQFAKNCNNT